MTCSCFNIVAFVYLRQKCLDLRAINISPIFVHSSNRRDVESKSISISKALDKRTIFGFEARIIEKTTCPTSSRSDFSCNMSYFRHSHCWCIYIQYLLTPICHICINIIATLYCVLYILMRYKMKNKIQPQVKLLIIIGCN